MQGVFYAISYHNFNFISFLKGKMILLIKQCKGQEWNY